eukprot:4789832-Lingulodinium_polyedra.AAC.1
MTTINCVARGTATLMSRLPQQIDGDRGSRAVKTRPMACEMANASGQISTACASKMPTPPSCMAARNSW